MRETRTTEFKEKITNTFLKTVSAFSNYDGGEIFFGIDDNGNIKGLSDVKQACLDIENKPPCLSLISTTINETSQPISS